LLVGVAHTGVIAELSGLGARLKVAKVGKGIESGV
jgi:hypothetical protein